MALLVKNARLVTMDASRRVLQGDLLVEGARIVRVGTISGRDMVQSGRLAVIDGTGLWCLPGLVQAHVHLCQTLFRNQAEDMDLLDWLRRRIWPLEAAHDEDSMAASARLGIAELLASGTTTVLDMGSVRHTDVLFGVARETGIRYVGGKAMMDDPDVPASLRELTADSLRESDRLRDAWDGREEGRLRYAYAPRFALSCTDALLRAVGERSAAGARVHTHASEQKGECDLVKKTRGADTIRYLQRAGLCGKRSVFAHCVWPAAGELDVMAETETAVAHCPGSNLKLASGIAPVPEMLAMGIRVGLGADGAPCNNTLDAWHEMRLAALLQRPRLGPGAMPALTVLEMATIGGAAALGLDGEIGSLEPGKQADLVLVDPRGPHAQPLTEDPWTPLVHALGKGDVRHVVVAGRAVVRDGLNIGVSTDSLSAQSVRAWNDLRGRAGI
jgi:cytosine/adenosine deaminase-related metal-dependent hydrolase